MATERSITKLFSFLITMMLLLSGSLPAQTAAAAASTPADLPAYLGAGDWAQIKALLPAAAQAAPNNQQAYLKASNPGLDYQFGYAVAISGNTIVVGAPNETANAMVQSGAAYVFTRTGTTWSQQAYLTASNAGLHDYFGYAVSIDDDTIVVGAYTEYSNATGVNGDETDNSAAYAGAAYVFIRSKAGTWSQQAYLKASNTDAGDYFGYSVSVSGDTIVVGAPQEDSITTGVDGDGTDDTAANAGAAYVFSRTDTTWSQQAYLKASNTDADDNFGQSVSLDGSLIAVGAPHEDSKGTGIDSYPADNTVSNAGAVYVFSRASSTWSQQVYLKASNSGEFDNFGIAVSLSGNTLVVGAPYEDSNATGVNGDQRDNSASGAGAAYVFTRIITTWSQQAYLKASNTDANDAFSARVSISGDTLVVGAYGEDSSATGLNGDQADNSASNSGAAYVFLRKGTAWSQHAYLKASNAETDDLFGLAVSVSGDTLVVGAYDEDSNATGVNGDQANNLTGNSGAAYVFVPLPIYEIYLPLVMK